MHHPVHKSLKAAYSFYNIHTETPLLDLMNDALIIAKLVSYRLGFFCFIHKSILRSGGKNWSNLSMLVHSVLLSTAQSAVDETYTIYISKNKALCLFFLFTLSDAGERQMHKVFAIAWTVETPKSTLMTIVTKYQKNEKYHWKNFPWRWINKCCQIHFAI